MEKIPRVIIKSAAAYLKSQIDNNSSSSAVATKLVIDSCIPHHWPYPITEFVCDEGIHMASICMKICANVLCKSKENHVFYITMKNTFSTEILSQEILNLGSHAKDIQQRVIVYDICSFVELISVVYSLQSQHIDKVKVGMVIIDGLCFQPNSCEVNSNYLKVPYLMKLFHLLKKIAIQNSFIVVIANDAKSTRRKREVFAYHDERHYNYVDLRTLVQLVEDGKFVLKMMS